MCFKLVDLGLGLQEPVNLSSMSVCIASGSQATKEVRISCIDIRWVERENGEQSREGKSQKVKIITTYLNTVDRDQAMDRTDSFSSNFNSKCLSLEVRELRLK